MGRTRGAGPPLFLDQNEAPRVKKFWGGDHRPPLSKGMDDSPPPPPYLKVWIRHCDISYYVKIKLAKLTLLVRHHC